MKLKNEPILVILNIINHNNIFLDILKYIYTNIDKMYNNYNFLKYKNKVTYIFIHVYIYKTITKIIFD